MWLLHLKGHLSIWSKYCTKTYLSCRIDQVGPEEEAKARVEFIPTAEGTCLLVVKFESDKLSNITNSVNIVVTKPVSSEDWNALSLVNVLLVVCFVRL